MTENILASVQLDSNDEAAYLQTIYSGKHLILADEPPVYGGKDQGSAPYGLLLAALAACTSITLQMKAAEKGWKLGPIRIHLVILRADVADGTGEERIMRTIVLAPEVPSSQRAELKSIAETTPVTNTLRHGMKIETTVESSTPKVPPALRRANAFAVLAAAKDSPKDPK